VQGGQGAFSSDVFAFHYDIQNDNTYVDLGYVDTSAFVEEEAHGAYLF